MKPFIQNIVDSVKKLSSDKKKIKYYRKEKKGTRWEIELLDKKGNVISTSGGFTDKDLKSIVNLEEYEEWQS